MRSAASFLKHLSPRCRTRWRKRCASARQATWFCSPRHARASTCSITMSTADAFLKRRSGRYPMARKVRPDRVLFVVTLTLVAFGVAMVFSSSAIVAKEKFGDANYFAFKQLVAATLGLAVMFVIMKVDYHVYRNPAVVFSLLAVVVSLLVLVFFLPAQ